MAKIENKEVVVNESIELNDKDIMNLSLTTLKNMSKNYAVALTEASNMNLYKELKKQFDSISKLQRDTFETIFRYGWYKLEEAVSSKVGEQYNTLNDCFTKIK